MSKDALIESIQAVADGLADNNFRISLGAPGNHLVNSIGETRPTGQAWTPEPKSFPIIFEGVARYFGTARQMTVSGTLVSTDHRIELAANSVAVALPAPSATMIGQYVVKSLGFTGGTITGTIDGSAMPIPVAGWDFVQIYCNGSSWLTG